LRDVFDAQAKVCQTLSTGWQFSPCTYQISCIQKKAKKKPALQEIIV
jgi:hypothetical protein